VGGVAGDQHPAVAPALGDQAVEAVDRFALDLDVHVPGAQQALDEGVVQRLLGRLAWQQHEFPPVPARAHQDAGGWPGGVADLQVDVGQPAAGAGQGVDHQPRLVELEVREADPERLAHRAPGAIAADQVVRFDHQIAVRPGERGFHRRRRRPQRLELDAQPDLGPG